MTKTAQLSMTARECFMTANGLFDRGHYLDAQTMFDRACKLEPDNAVYAEGRERLRLMAFGFGKKGGGKGLSFDFAECGEGCCECCGEGCGEGLCEGICSSCDGCDCDCG